MRVIVFLLAAITVLAWLAVELRGTSRDISNVLVALSILLAFLLFGALFGVYGG